jgi:hypothetical protein
MCHYSGIRQQSTKWYYQIRDVRSRVREDRVEQRQPRLSGDPNAIPMSAPSQNGARSIKKAGDVRLQTRRPRTQGLIDMLSQTNYERFSRDKSRCRMLNSTDMLR